MNPMKEIRIEKITLNIGVGQAGEKLEKAAKLLQNLADAKVVQTKSKKRIPGWGLRIGLPIGCKVTLRGKKAEEMLSRLLVAIDKRIALQKYFMNIFRISYIDSAFSCKKRSSSCILRWKS